MGDGKGWTKGTLRRRKGIAKTADRRNVLASLPLVTYLNLLTIHPFDLLIQCVMAGIWT